MDDRGKWRERELGKSVLAAWHDNDDDDDLYIYIYIYVCVCVCVEKNIKKTK